MFKAIVSLILFSMAVSCYGWEAPPDARVLDSTIMWDPTEPYVVMPSPDGSMIAYENRGAIWVCDIKEGSPKKLADVPDTVSGLLATDHPAPGNRLDSLRQPSGHQAYEVLRRRINEAHSLQWTRDQRGLIFGTRKLLPGKNLIWETLVVYSPLKGSPEVLATIERGSYEFPQRPTYFHVTPDKRYIVLAGSSDLLMCCPLIWDVQRNQPRMTPFDYLLPSVASDRYLGIEIDTRQLVLVDNDFKVIERYDVTFDPRRHQDLTWSPDEQFAVCRIYFEHPKDHQCQAFRINLKSSERTPLADGVVSDNYYFDGKDGQAIKIGRFKNVRGYTADGGQGMYAEAINADGDTNIIWEFKNNNTDRTLMRDRVPYPGTIFDTHQKLFAVPWPRDGNGFHCHLIDSTGIKWPFPDDDPNEYISPFKALAFADNGDSIVGYREDQLFVVPVTSIKKEAKAE